MIAAKTKYFKIKNPETGEFEALISIKGEKGDIGGLSNITGEYGTSEELAASQALVSKLDSYCTTALNNHEQLISGINDDLYTKEQSIRDINSKIGTPILHPTLNKYWPIYEVIGSPMGTDAGGVVTIYEWLRELESRLSALEGK